MSEPSDHFEIPESIVQAFAGKPWLNEGELAEALHTNAKTIAAHWNAGDLPYTEIGVGKIRPRRVSTLSQVAKFLMKQERVGTCQSESRAPMGFSNRRARRSGTGGGNTKVVRFEDRRAKLTALARGKSPKQNSHASNARSMARSKPGDSR
jgi:hypothetical protein